MSSRTGSRKPPTSAQGYRESPRLPVPVNIPRPPYVNSLQAPVLVEDIQVQDEEGITGMKAAGKPAARVLNYAGTLVQDGDIINIDVTVYLNGYHGDTSRTFYCGYVDDEAKQLVEVTREALEKAISICGPGVEIQKIGKVIENVTLFVDRLLDVYHSSVTKIYIKRISFEIRILRLECDIAGKYNYGVVRHFVGHGVGKIFPSGPSVLHFRNSERGRMVVNQTFTTELMLTIGVASRTKCGVTIGLWQQKTAVCRPNLSIPCSSLKPV